jgi:SAM-dependent methyltransferase
VNRPSTCPVCRSRALIPLVYRAQVPVHQNLILDDQMSARAVARGDLDLTVCDACGFTFNQAFDLSKLRYGEHYDNRQTCSPSFGHYIDNLVSDLVLEKGVRNCQIVEVGCGDGSFLRRLVQFEGAANRGYGFDPSYVGPASDLDGRLIFQKQYYGPACADITADVVICRHVIEHVPHPVVLLSAIRQALARSPRARLFLETPCLEWILRNQVIWDLFYEHCSYFTLDSLTTTFEIAGFSVESRHRVFGQQYLWLEARVAANRLRTHHKPGSTRALATQFAAAEGPLRREWESKIQELATNGKTALWGAGAKGVTLANLVDPQCRWIDCIVDLNPQKQGHYLPGTGHPIVSPHDLGQRQVTAAVVMNHNYLMEVSALLRKDHLDIKLFF